LDAFYGQALFNADISGMYLVQSLDCGVYHNCDTTTAVRSYTPMQNLAHSCIQLHTPAHCSVRTGSDKHSKKKKKEKESASLLCYCWHG